MSYNFIQVFLILIYNAFASTLLRGLAKAENDEYAAEALIDTTTASIEETVTASFLEFNILGFRLWMILGLVIAAFGIVIIILCCLFDCRIPRTKQEIDLQHEKKLLAKRMTRQLDKIPPGYNLKIVRGKLPTGAKTTNMMNTSTLPPVPSIALNTLPGNSQQTDGSLPDISQSQPSASL